MSISLLACSVESGSESGSVGSSEIQIPIYNGTPISEVNSGVVKLFAPCGEDLCMCSGTLITNSKVLTARHCVDESVDDPWTVYVTVATNESGGYQAALGSQVFLHPDPNIDVAVVWMNSSFTMFGSVTGYRRDIAMASPEQLHGGVLVIDGYGLNTLSGGDGVLRRGLCSAADRHPLINPSGALNCNNPAPGGGTIQTYGDSGGPGWIFTTGMPLVYVQSTTFFDLVTGVPYQAYGYTTNVWFPWAFWYLQ